HKCVIQITSLGRPLLPCLKLLMLPMVQRWHWKPCSVRILTKMTSELFKCMWTGNQLPICVHGKNSTEVRILDWRWWKAVTFMKEEVNFISSAHGTRWSCSLKNGPHNKNMIFHFREDLKTVLTI